MNWSKWRCWFGGHEYRYHEIGMDPRDPEASEQFLDSVAEQLGGNRLGLKRCQRCGHFDQSSPAVLDKGGEMITMDEFAEQRYRNEIERIASIAEERQGGNVHINLPSLSAEPIPVREALRKVAEMDIAAARGSITFNCSECKTSISVTCENYPEMVRCPRCGRMQAVSLP